VATYAVELYEAYALKKGISQKNVDAQRDKLRLAAMLHDVGKVAISDLILKKPGKFTDEEYDIMKQHAMLGAQLFADARSEFDEYSAEVALNHHERWDGKGYPGHIDVTSGNALSGKVNEKGKPLGKKGKEIPLLGRIVALADVYDALSSRRVYKDAWDEEKVLDLIREGSGGHFDPELVDIFVEIMDGLRAVRASYPDED